MKKILIALSAVALLTACNNKKEHTEDEVTAVALEDTVATDNTEVAVPEIPKKPVAGERITVKGKVTEINNGKDGYTAKIMTLDGDEYAATISIPNMENPTDYREVTVGETIKITGEAVHIENDVLVKVTKLR